MKREVFAAVREDRAPGRDPRDEHVVALGRGDGRGTDGRAALLQSGRGDAARRDRPSRTRRPTSSSRPRGTSSRSCSKRGVLVGDAPGFVVNRVLTRMTTRADGCARERQHRRGDGRGDPAARHADGAVGAAADGRPARREPRARDDARRLSRSLPALADARDFADGTDEIVVAATRARPSRRSATAVLEALADEVGHLLDEGVVGDRRRRRRVPDPRRRLPVLPRRDHEASRPARASRSGSSARTLAD